MFNRARRRLFRILLSIILLLLLVIGAMFAFRFVKWNEEQAVTIVSEASLREVLEISELSTVDYTYNAIARVYDDDNEDIIYYVAYEGKVAAGINFDEIEIDVNEEEKTVTINIPEVQILEVNVDTGTLEYIFTKDKYETETISAEALEYCREDLLQKATQEEKLLELARENSVTSVKALFMPWIEQLDNEYTVSIN